MQLIMLVQQSKMQSKFVTTLILLLVSSFVVANSMSDVLKFFSKNKKCFQQKHPLLCLREKVIVALNETILDDRPIAIGFVEIQKNPTYFKSNDSQNGTEETGISTTVTGRSYSSLKETLMDKIVEFFKSRTLKVNLSNAFEGRHIKKCK